ncbi:hypothetical protein NLI96_g2867 [Meripilus lineatus]|uniref:Uncharacterized protein n=1 Tax=Meripilus lineatus TaxID=2056292 RepID=A0AAD5V9Z5_9APHY|nr:hypothetical protein NLI96_g2867 [Physisporinus lineatus]
MLEVHRLDSILGIGIEVTTAISSLSNLIILSVGGVCERGVEFLNTIKAPLRGLSVGFQDVLYPNQITTLGACASTLSFLDVTPGTISSQPIEMIFPFVETLRLPVNDCLSSTSIFRSFPNLKRFDLVAMNEELTYEDVREDHEVNMAKLDLYDGPIPNLEILVGDTYAMHQSAFYCPVKKLLVDPLDEERADRVILPLVRRCRPSILRILLNIDYDAESFDFLEPFFAELVNATELKELWLVVAPDFTFAKETPLEDFIVRGFNSFTISVLTTLTRMTSHAAWHDFRYNDWDEFVSNFDLDSWVLVAANAIPSLRQVIMFSMARCTQNRYVIIGDGDEERSVTMEPDLDGPWTFGFGYNVEEIPYSTTCMLRPSSSTARATLRGIESSIGNRDSWDSVSGSSESGTSHSGSFAEDHDGEDGDEEGDDDEDDDDKDEDEGEHY